MQFSSWATMLNSCAEGHGTES